MTVLEFKKYLNKEYSFDKIFDYILAILSLSGGLFFVYELVLTKWTEIWIFILTLLFSIFLIYYGIVGFMRIPFVTNIYIIINNDGAENNKKRIQQLSEKLNLFTYPYLIGDNILKLETKRMFGKKELFFYCDDKGIYFNVQHKNYRDPKYGYFRSTKKIIKKITFELKNN